MQTIKPMRALHFVNEASFNSSASYESRRRPPSTPQPKFSLGDEGSRSLEHQQRKVDDLRA